MICCLLGLACSAKSSVPELPPSGTIAPRSDGAAARELSVVYAGPRGAAERNSTISLLFDRPLRALDAAARVPAIILEPALPGQWQWAGARGVTFAPTAKRLPGATSFRVVVPAGTPALDGTRLAAPYELTFETPTPHVLRASPEPGASGEEPDARITLDFDQPVPVATIEREARLIAWRAERRETIPFDVRSSRGSADRIDILPRRPLPLGSSIEFLLPAGLRGAEGPRPLPEPWSLRFDTYGPLRVLGVNCNIDASVGRCDPEGAVWVELSNPVEIRQLTSHVVIEPPVELRWSDDLDGQGRYVHLPLPGGLAPSTTYRVSITAGVVDTHGQKLAQTRQVTLSTANYAPRVQLPVSGEVFVPPLTELGLVSRNTLDLQAFSRRLDANGLLDLYAAQNDYEKNSELLSRFATGGAAVPGAIDNQVRSFPIALGPALGAGPARGAAWIGWRSAGTGVMGQVVQVTDLGLTAKLSDQGSLVWVTRLGTGLPVAGATVELVGRTPKLARSYRTDASGLVTIPKQDYAPHFSDYGSDEDTLLFARYEGDSSFRRVADFLPPWRVDVPMRLSVSEKEYALLFGERGIYRPGDVVRVKGILRREAPSGNTLLAGRRLALELSDPFGEVAEKLSIETSRFGTFAADVHLPGSAALGQWRVAAEGFPDDALAIQIAEYRAAEFKVGVDAAAATYLPGESARFHVQADYLFGSPMSGMSLGYGVTRERTSFSPPGWEGYVTSEDSYRRDLPNVSLDANVIAHAEATLSAAGAHEVSVPLVLPGQTGPERIRLDASVTDVSRQAIASSAAALVHPARHYVGLALEGSWFFTVPSTLEPRVLALTPRGETKAGRPVQLELVRRRWTLAREKTEDGWRTLSAPVDEVQARCGVVTAAAPVSCALQLRESGQFFVRAQSPDEQGRVARSALELYAIGEGRPGWADNDQRKLELVLDKAEYRVGDTAKVLIKNPFLRAEALLTLERAGLYEHRRLTLEGPTPSVDIPIDERLRPNAFVSVHLVQGVAAAPPSAADVTPEPGYRVGYALLRVDPEARRLGVAVTPASQEYRPGQRVHFDLRVTRAGAVPHPAELTVYAVDEGVLSLTNYQPPDPVAIFTAPRPLAVATVESREALGRLLLPGLERDKGMDGGGGGALGVRENFRTTAFFDPHIETDAEGRAGVDFELPDNLTTFRLMAVAVSDDDRYGVGSTTFSVNKPLMLRPALPRLLRAGDRFEASVIVDGRADAADVTVGLSLTGAQLEGPAARAVHVEKGQSSEVRFTVLTAQPGEARFDFTATGAKVSDRLQTTRRVESPTALETTAVYGRTEQAEAQALGDLRELRSDVGGLTLTLASTALVGLDASLGQLVNYPYACTEQLASGLLPLAPLRGLSERYGLALPSDLGAAVEARVGQILARQRGEGGFGLWPDSPEPQPWVSAYALWVLDQAKRTGARVPARTFELGVAYLRQWLSEPHAAPAEWATAALMADTLAALGQPDAEYTTQLFDRRSELPSFARALLLHAAVSGKSDPAQIATLGSELEALVSVHGNKAGVAEPSRQPLSEIFDSEARTEALVLWALLAKDPRHPLAEPLARGVLERRDAGHWRSTQESAYALLALDAYRQAWETESPQFEAAVWFGKQALLRASFDRAGSVPRAHSIGMAELARLSGNLMFEKQGPGVLYYEARLAYAAQRLPEAPLERGFSLSKSLRPVAIESLAVALAAPFEPGARPETFAGGALVLVDVVVAAPTRRHFVVIDDPLPAGFEAVDASLATSSPALDVSQDATGEPEASGFRTSWYRRELRDDRVLFFVDSMPAGLYRYRYLARATSLGRFVVPPTRVLEMYQPEVFGRTGASVVEIR
jgi:alpha-2-macroglobulin